MHKNGSYSKNNVLRTGGECNQRDGCSNTKKEEDSNREKKNWRVRGRKNYIIATIPRASRKRQRKAFSV